MEDTNSRANGPIFIIRQMTKSDHTFGKFHQTTTANPDDLLTINLLAKEITWHKLNDLKMIQPKSLKKRHSKSDHYSIKENRILFILEDGTKLEPANVSKVNESGNESNMLQASMMIGKTVTYINDSNQEVSALIKSVSFKNGNTTFQLDDGANTALKSSQIIKIE